MTGNLLSFFGRVAGWVIPPELDRDAIIGDLEEEHTERVASHGRYQADRWLLSQCVRSVGHILRMRISAQTIRRSTTTILLAWLSWAAVFLALGGASVLLFSALLVPSGLRILVYLGIAFVAAATGGRVVRRSQPVDSTGTAVVFAVLVATSIGAIFLAAPEDQGPAVWVVWTTVVASGVFFGAHSLTARHREAA